jgi:heterodisulfide reductase subunit C
MPSNKDMSNLPRFKRKIQKAIKDAPLSSNNELDNAKQLLYHLYNTGRVDGKDIDDSIVEVECTWQQLSNLIKEIIKGNEKMVFGNTYPVFKSLEEYIEHVALIRKILRDEQNKVATNLGFNIGKEVE